MNNQKGFTLMELIVVMAILAIITGSVLGAYTSSQKKARDAQRKSDLKQIQSALEAYASDHSGQYPDADAGQIKGCPADADTGSTDGTTCSWGAEDFRVDSGAVYMAKIPTDPKNIDYFYRVSTNNTKYQFYACLENDRDNDYNGTDYTWATCAGCGTGNQCTYGVSSSNAKVNEASL